MLSKGEKINKYEIIEEIARGGEACIYRALDTFKNVEIALKVIHEFHASQDPEITRLFLREGKILSEIDNPGIIRVYESNVANVAGRNLYYHAIELIDDETLDYYIKHNSSDWRKTIRIIRAIAEIVAILHERELPVLHRDLKPSNIFLMDAGNSETPAEMKIFDFGLARFEFERTITAPDAFRGTLKYSAPELKRVGGKASKASDIYSLGRTLEEMLGETVASDVPRWILSLKEIMCDASFGNRPSAREVVDIIDEQTHSGSSIFASTTKLSAIRNRIRIKKHKILIKLSAYMILVFALAFVIYQLIPRPAEIYFNIKPNQAQVFLDSEEQDLNDGESHRITAGNHILRFEHEGYLDHYKEISVKSNEEIAYGFDFDLRGTPLVNWIFDNGESSDKEVTDLNFKGHPMIFDPRGDGQYEVVVASSRRIYRFNGITGICDEFWPQDIDGYIAEAGPAHFDCDNDGCEDIIYAISGHNCNVTYSTVICISGKDNSLIWHNGKNKPVEMNDCPLSSTITVIQLEKDGEHVIVVPVSEGQLYLLDTKDGRPIWEKETSFEWKNPVEFRAVINNSTPAFHDFNNDGFLDIVICTMEVIAERPEELPGGIVMISGKNGEVLASVESLRATCSPGIADLDSDGIPEIVAADEEGMIHVLDFKKGLNNIKEIKEQMYAAFGEQYSQCSSSPAFYIDPRKGCENEIRFAIANHNGEICFYGYDGEKIFQADKSWQACGEKVMTDPLAVKVGDHVLFAGGSYNGVTAWTFYPSGKFDKYSFGQERRIWHGILPADIDRDGGMEILVGTVCSDATSKAQSELFACLNVEENPVEYIEKCQYQINGQPVILNTAIDKNPGIFYPSQTNNGTLVEINIENNVQKNKPHEIPGFNRKNIERLFKGDFTNDNLDDVFVKSRDGYSAIYSPRLKRRVWTTTKEEYAGVCIHLIENNDDNILVFLSTLKASYQSKYNTSMPISRIQFLRWDKESGQMVEAKKEITFNCGIGTSLIPYETATHEKYIAIIGDDPDMDGNLNKVVNISVDSLLRDGGCLYEEITVNECKFNKGIMQRIDKNNPIVNINGKTYMLYLYDNHFIRSIDLENGVIEPCPWDNLATLQCWDILQVGDFTSDGNQNLVIFSRGENKSNIFLLIDVPSGEVISRYSFNSESTILKYLENISSEPMILFVVEMNIKMTPDNAKQTRLFAQLIRFNNKTRKLELYWSRKLPDNASFNPLVYDFDNDGIPCLLFADTLNHIHIYPIKPFNNGRFQFRSDRKIFDPEKWKKQ